MSSEIERRLEAMLADAPEPDPGAGEKALHRALRALHPMAAPRRGLRTAVLAFAAVVVLLVIAAGSLAAAGALHVSFGGRAQHRPATVPLSLPKGVNGVAAIVDGRLSVVTRGGFRLQVPATAAALSPHALYVAAGIGDSLVAMAPDGRLAWRHPTGGKVVAIAWAPDGLRIAYVVRVGRRLVLRMIYGNGRHDVLIDHSVRSARPSWRADNLAFAYVGAGGKAIVYDLAHQSRSVVSRSAAVGAVTQLAYAPAGSALVVGGRGGMVYATRHAQRYRVGLVEAAGWLSKSLAIVVDGAFSPGFEPTVLNRLAGPVVAFASSGSRYVAGVGTEGQIRLVAGARSGIRTIGLLPRNATLSDLEIR